jgi:predicted dehydrogenase
LAGGQTDGSAPCAATERQFTAEPDKGHRRMLQEFIREIRGERGPVCPVSDAVTATRICLAAAKSYIEKRPVMMVEICG